MLWMVYIYRVYFYCLCLFALLLNSLNFNVRQDENQTKGRKIYVGPSPYIKPLKLKRETGCPFPLPLKIFNHKINVPYLTGDLATGNLGACGELTGECTVLVCVFKVSASPHLKLHPECVQINVSFTDTMGTPCTSFI